MMPLYVSAFTDYNTHLGRDQLSKFDDTTMFATRFEKRTNQWYSTLALPIDETDPEAVTGLI